jgi:hypothetical protein
MFNNVGVSYLAGINQVNPRSFQNSQISLPLFELAAFHLCFLTREIPNVETVIGNSTTNHHLLFFYHSVSLSPNQWIAPLIFIHTTHFQTTQFYNVRINSVSTHLAIDVIRQCVVSAPEFEATHALFAGSRVSSSSLFTINLTKPKPRGLPTHNCHGHSSSSLNGWSHAHYC